MVTTLRDQACALAAMTQASEQWAQRARGRMLHEFRGRRLWEDDWEPLKGGGAI